MVDDLKHLLATTSNRGSSSLLVLSYILFTFISFGYLPLDGWSNLTYQVKGGFKKNQTL